MIDSAIQRRFTPFYLGYFEPDFRKEWIKHSIDKLKGEDPQRYKKVVRFFEINSLADSNPLVEFVSRITVNFTSALYKDLLNQKIFIEIENLEQDNINQESKPNLILRWCTEFCEQNRDSQNIYIGGICYPQAVVRADKQFG